MKLLTFLRKNIPLSLKCRQLLGTSEVVRHTSYRVRPQTPYMGVAPGPHGDIKPLTPILWSSKTSLSYTLSGVDLS